jgi:hypothetical protein
MPIGQVLLSCKMAPIITSASATCQVLFANWLKLFKSG